MSTATQPVSHSVPWDPDSFCGYSADELVLIRKGFMAALDRVYEIEIADTAAKRERLRGVGARRGLSIAPEAVGEPLRLLEPVEQMRG